MPKLKKTVELLFTGACTAEYWDEDGKHRVEPGEPVKFTEQMSKDRLAEPVWELAPEQPATKKTTKKTTKQGGDK